MLDVSVAYNRYRFVGNEFLTWLWFVVATNAYAPFLQNGADEGSPPVNLGLGDRIVLKNRHDQGEETLTITGSGADWEEGAVALKKGAQVNELSLLFEQDQHTWKVTLKGESLHLTGLKTPQGGKIYAPEETEAAVLEKFYLYDQIVQWIDQLFFSFVRLRISDQWNSGQLPAVRNWIKAS